jgi:hypothetical protein
LYEALLRAEEDHRRMMESENVINVPAEEDVTDYIGRDK